MTPADPHVPFPIELTTISQDATQVVGLGAADLAVVLRAIGADVVVDQPADVADVAHGRLTQQELRIVQLIGTGLSNAEIAEQLPLSINTVKSYIRSAYQKIGVRSRSEAVLWTVQRNLASAASAVPVERDSPAGHPTERGA